MAEMGVMAALEARVERAVLAYGAEMEVIPQMEAMAE